MRSEQFTAAVEAELKQDGMSNGVTNGKAEARSGPPPLIISMDQTKPEKVDWLRPNKIPIGRLTLIDGIPRPENRGSLLQWLPLSRAVKHSRSDIDRNQRAMFC